MYANVPNVKRKEAFEDDDVDHEENDHQEPFVSYNFDDEDDDDDDDDEYVEQ